MLIAGSSNDTFIDLDSNTQPVEIAQRFVLPDPTDRCVSLKASFTGMSGGRVFQIETERGARFALKHYSPHQSVDRIGQIHSWIDRVAMIDDSLVQRRLQVREAKSTLLCFAKTAWELSPWIEGEPLGVDASEHAIQMGIQAIVRFHELASSLGQRVGRPPSLAERYRLLDPVRELPSMESVFAATEAWGSKNLTQLISKASWLLSQHWPNVSQALRAELTRLDQEYPMQLVLRDVHREHILFGKTSEASAVWGTQKSWVSQKKIDLSGRLSETDATGSKRFGVAGQPMTPPDVQGILDFDAMRFDLPELDIARWLGSFCGAGRDFQEAFEKTLGSSVPPRVMADANTKGSFQKEILLGTRRVSGSQRALILLLHQCGVWIGLANWVTWVTEGRPFSADIDAISGRIEQLCDQAERLKH